MDSHDKPSVPAGLTMQEMFMKYPVGTKLDGKTVTGYRQTKSQSSVVTSDNNTYDVTNDYQPITPNPMASES